MPRRNRVPITKTKTFNGREDTLVMAMLYFCIGSKTVESVQRPSSGKQGSSPASPGFPSWAFDLDKIDEILTRIDQVDTSLLEGPFSVFPSRLPGLHQEVALVQKQKNFDIPSLSLLSPVQELPWLTGHIIYPGRQLTRRLFHHYISDVVHVLQPIMHSRNFYTTVYVPQAIMGGSSPCVNEISLPSHRAIFYSLLATAAFHVRGMVAASLEHSQQITQVAHACRVMAYRFLRTALASGFQTDMEWLAILSTILSFVTIDVMEGSMSEYYLHLEAFQHLDLLGTRSKTDAPGSTSRMYLQTAFYLQLTLSETTNFHLPGIPWPPNTGISTELTNSLARNPAIDDHMLQHTYGLTHTLCSFIRAVTVLYRHRSYYLGLQQPLPVGLRKAVVTMETKIKTWEIGSEMNLLSIDDKSTTGVNMMRIMNLHLSAFHNAIQIYFITHLSPSFNQSDPDNNTTAFSHDLPFLVEQVAANLIEIEKMKREISALANRQIAPIMWPGFIASCESRLENREVWLKWWGEMMDYHIGNVHLLWQTVQDVWRFRDEIQSRGQLVHDIPLWRAYLAKSVRNILPL
ncbi:hypothetical protein UA08_03673 [Talaromyces atroroseus]|uniref:Transcription factor domain-containing protein n=1 Tax=Talaromyces atroroseus TaxID=1441469 RepID=A0A225AHU0_TALAT|nr:hypothetical protein UA08_03673 [Talaromyces atroroseus]OKL61001.1 hypothetical protein UA08_03673 [Talaromyces atroroseus]